MAAFWHEKMEKAEEKTEYVHFVSGAGYPAVEEYADYAHSDYEKVYRRIIELDEALEPLVDEVHSIVPPQKWELKDLLHRMQTGDESARERIIMMHLRVALRIALHRAEAFDMDIEDVVSEACIALVQSLA